MENEHEELQSISKISLFDLFSNNLKFNLTKTIDGKDIDVPDQFLVQSAGCRVLPKWEKIDGKFQIVQGQYKGIQISVYDKTFTDFADQKGRSYGNLEAIKVIVPFSKEIQGKVNAKQLKGITFTNLFAIAMPKLNFYKQPYVEICLKADGIIEL